MSNEPEEVVEEVTEEIEEVVEEIVEEVIEVEEEIQEETVEPEEEEEDIPSRKPRKLTPEELGEVLKPKRGRGRPRKSQFDSVISDSNGMGSVSSGEAKPALITSQKSDSVDTSDDQCTVELIASYITTEIFVWRRFIQSGATGKKKIRATVMGPIAIHKRLGDTDTEENVSPGKWSLTHVPTGLTILHLMNMDESFKAANLLYQTCRSVMRDEKDREVLIQKLPKWLKPWIQSCKEAGNKFVKPNLTMG